MTDPLFSSDPHAHLFSSADSIQPRQTQPQYTTAGTVYNPDANLPIQPPVRRGRTLRWPPQSAAELASIPKSLLRSLPLDGAVPQSPPTTASSLQRYSPLQQNTYKAATPGAGAELDPSDFSSTVKASTMSSTATSGRLPVGIQPPPGFSIARPQSSQKNKDYGAIGDGRHEVAPQDRKILAQFNNRTLTNLASYPNPKQQSAKEFLDAARPSSTVSNSQDSAISQPSYGTSELQQNMPSDPLRLARPSAGASDAPARPIPTAPRALLESTNARATASQVPIAGKSHFTVLSRGPGAPQPLTAGPPGQRQYKASTFESTFNAMQESSYKSMQRETAHQPTINSAPSPVRRGLNPLRPTFTPAAQRVQQHTAGLPTSVEGLPRETRPISHIPNPVAANFQPLERIRKGSAEAPESNTSWMLALLRDESETDTLEKPLQTNLRSNKEIRDTLPQEAIRKYYPEGFPRDYTRRPRPSEQMWLDATDPTIPHQRFEKSDQLVAWENADINEAFYAGAHDFGRSAKHFSREVERRHLDQKLGWVAQPKNQSIGIPNRTEWLGRPNFRPLSTEEALAIPTCYDTDVILNLGFKSFVNYDKDEGDQLHQQIFSRVPRSVISDSDDSHRNFWRDSSQETAARVTLPKRFTGQSDNQEVMGRANKMGTGIDNQAFGSSAYVLNLGRQRRPAVTGLGISDGRRPAALASTMQGTDPSFLSFGSLSFQSPETASSDSDYGFSTFSNTYRGSIGKGPSRTD